MAREDAVMVVVEARLAFRDLRDFGIVVRRAEVAPAIDDVHFGRFARMVGLDDADPAAVWPLRCLQRGKRGAQARMMGVDTFPARAYAGAAADLVAKAARAAAAALEAERLQAKRVVVGKRP